MVQLMKSGDLQPELHTMPCTEKVPVKLEIEDSLEEEHGPLNKRPKPSPAFQEVQFCILFLFCLRIFIANLFIFIFIFIFIYFLLLFVFVIWTYQSFLYFSFDFLCIIQSEIVVPRN